MESVSARLDHAITVIEVMASRVDAWDDRIEHVTKQERALSALARRLGSAALSLSAARLLPQARWLVATSFGAFVGGVVGSIVWQWAHAAAALAGP